MILQCILLDNTFNWCCILQQTNNNPLRFVLMLEKSTHETPLPNKMTDKLRDITRVLRAQKQQSTYGILPIRVLQILELVPTNNGVGDRAGGKAKGCLVYRLIYSNKKQSKLYNAHLLDTSFSTNHRKHYLKTKKKRYMYDVEQYEHSSKNIPLC